MERTERAEPQYVIRYRISVERKWQFIAEDGGVMAPSMQLAQRYSKPAAESYAEGMRAMRLRRKYGHQRAHLIVEVLPYTPGS